MYTTTRMTTMKKRLFLFKYLKALSSGQDKNVLSSVILSRLYGVHAKHTWQCFPLDIHDILQRLVALRWPRYIQCLRQCNAADDWLHQVVNQDDKVLLPMELGTPHPHIRQDLKHQEIQSLLSAQTTSLSRQLPFLFRNHFQLHYQRAWLGIGPHRYSLFRRRNITR